MSLIDKKRQLKLLQEHTEAITPILEKREWVEYFNVDRMKKISREVYMSSLFWEIIKTGKNYFKKVKRIVSKENKN